VPLPRRARSTDKWRLKESANANPLAGSILREARLRLALSERPTIHPSSIHQDECNLKKMVEVRKDSPPFATSLRRMGNTYRTKRQRMRDEDDLVRIFRIDPHCGRSRSPCRYNRHSQSVQEM
jgi:hypothetical protein